MKFRIVHLSDGRYRVEKRGFLFWRDAFLTALLPGGYGRDSFGSLKEAEDAMRKEAERLAYGAEKAIAKEYDL